MTKQERVLTKQEKGVKKKYTSVIVKEDLSKTKNYYVSLNIDQQAFSVKSIHAKSSAVWMQEQLAIALTRLINNEKGE